MFPYVKSHAAPNAQTNANISNSWQNAKSQVIYRITRYLSVIAGLLSYQSDDLPECHSKLDIHELAAVTNWSCQKVVRRVLRVEQMLK